MLVNTLKSFVFGRVRSYSIMKIGTHDGVFHCDEALACYMLMQLPEYKGAQIVRSRDKNILNDCDIVVDVGGIFDHQKKLYDHHQREFQESLSSLRPDLGNKYDIKLSSAGLVYCFYGEEILRQITPKNISSDPKNTECIYKRVYESLIQEIDAIDNGIPMFDGEPRYKINTSLSSQVARINPAWNAKVTESQDELFQKAMKLVGDEFQYVVNYLVNIWFPCRELVLESIKKRFETHSSGEIIELNSCFPWLEHFFLLEQELNLDGVIKYAVFCDGFSDTWRIRAVPTYPQSFVLRNPLNPNWWGTRDETLCELSGVEGAIFCHGNGFIGGAKSREAALAMAIGSLKTKSTNT